MLSTSVLPFLDRTGVEVIYMVAALLFILGLKRLSGVRTARIGNAYASLGMALAVIATMFLIGEVNWIVLAGGVLVGSFVGILLATGAMSLADEWFGIVAAVRHRG